MFRCGKCLGLLKSDAMFGDKGRSPGVGFPTEQDTYI